MKDIFDAIYLINLKRRPDRLQATLEALRKADWPFREPIIFPAVDGGKLPIPPGWNASAGAWGLRQSHVRVLEDCIQNGTEPILVLEDDICFKPNFREECERFFRDLPSDWDGIMLGGSYRPLPPLLKENVMRCIGVSCTHAYAVRGELLHELYQTWASPAQLNYIDSELETLQSRYRIYGPKPFLVGQRSGYSDIVNDVMPERF